ncbi:uncharacterized protein [Malus domestica]|uniref:uncharacterized protein n=1 Tax=Malus domestica TaxID=3750 RepID=UPI0039766949
MQQGALHGFRETPNGVPIMHLSFTDDSELFGNATVDEAQRVVDVLKVYVWGSSQEIDMSKSLIFFCSKTTKLSKKEIEKTLGNQCKEGFGKYLRLEEDFGHSKKVVFEEVRDKIKTRMAGWAEQFLSQAWKEVLVKVMAMAMPNYAMSCFKLPIGVYSDIEKAIRNY